MVGRDVAKAERRVVQRPRVDARSVAGVALGGALGALARHLLVSGAGHPAAATFAVNLLGAFLLGVLLERLAGGARRRWRTVLGTGVLGGFTTYSGIALVVIDHLEAGDLWLAAGYGAGSVLAGLVAAGLGVLAGRRLREAAQ